ncbi:hypothetical protein [Inquilinus sp.]|uniref:hypothetical protein n=1 Tax=Inquilinus sp. TaxID=1932117 RepID=UPI003784BBE0
MRRPTLLALPALLALATPAPAQEAEGWGTNYHLGTFYAGLTNAGGAHLGIYCAEMVGVAGSAGPTGPYVLFSVPRKLAVTGPKATVSFLVGDKPMPVPMTATVEEASTSFDWRPSKAYTTDQMKALVEALRHGKTLSVGLADPTVAEPFTLAGSGAALNGILDCGKT